MEFLKGETEPSGDCGLFSAGIDVHGAGQFPHDSKMNTWYHRIECYGNTAPHADELRDKVLALLVTTEHDGELHKAVFMALESYGGVDTFRDGVLALVQQSKDRGALLAAAPAPPKPTYDEAKERELFEGSYVFTAACKDLGSNGEYLNPYVQSTLEGWLACAKSRAKSVEVGDE